MNYLFQKIVQVFEGFVIILNRKNEGAYLVTTLYAIQHEKFEWQKSRLMKICMMDAQRL